MCFGHALHVKGAPKVHADKGFLYGLRFGVGLSFQVVMCTGIGFVVAAGE